MTPDEKRTLRLAAAVGDVRSVARFTARVMWSPAYPIRPDLRAAGATPRIWIWIYFGFIEITVEPHTLEYQ